MSRNLTTAMKAAFASTVVRPVAFVEAYFNSGPIYLWSGIGSIAWNNHTWTGVGVLGKISPIMETSQIRADSFILSLSAIPSAMLANVLTEIRNGLPCNVWLGCLSSSGAIIADPFEAMSGRIDMATIDEGPETSMVSLTVENQLIDMHRSRERRYTDEDQRFDFPLDRGFEFVPSIQQWDGKWGQR